MFSKSVMLATRLRELRGKRTQSEVAEKIGLRPSTYAMYETGKREPSIQTMCRMADFYNVSIDTLVGRESKEDTFIKKALTVHLLTLQTYLQNVIDEISS